MARKKNNARGRDEYEANVSEMREDKQDENEANAKELCEDK